MTITEQQPVAEPYTRLWLELTSKCQLECFHCYADSGPGGGHGAMTAPDWLRLIDQAGERGVNMVQFIGGEPTMHPDFAEIMAYALAAGLDVEVYSNLVHVTDQMWDLFKRPGVSLAFSYYAADAAAHNAVTGRPTHAQTRRNAEIAVSMGIPIRAGVINVGDDDTAQAAIDDLRSMGITKIAVDRVRGVGRGGDGSPAPEELCGRCGQDVAGISADGDVTPCIFSRWLKVGNVRDKGLSEILESPEMAAAMATIPPPRPGVRNADPCDPNAECPPGFPPSSCDPRN